MADLTGRYPLSTPDGSSIPFEVARPHGALSQSYVTTAGSADFTIPDEIDIISILTDSDCIVTFAASGADAAALVDGVMAADTTIVPGDIMTILSPPVDKRSVSLRAISTNGTALISYYVNWSGLHLKSQIPRR